MSTNLRNFTKALYGFDHVIRTVPANAWDNASPCSEWSAREVAGHAMGVVSMVAARAEGRDPQHDFMGAPGKIAGAKPYEAWSKIRDEALEALDQQGVLQREVDMPMGKNTIDGMIGFLFADTLVHTWDLARAVKGDDRLDVELAALALKNLTPMAPMLAKTGNFAPAVDVPASADAQAKLLGLSGRKP